MYQKVLEFWFQEIDSKSWFRTDSQFDKQVEQRFLPVLEQASVGELFSWRSDPRGRLAEIIVLDQFSRNIHRNTALAFSRDPLALVLAQEAIVAGVPGFLSDVERSFLYMPFMHSESKLIHERAVILFGEEGLQGNYNFELRHKAIIDRFGRYPHRNEILGRSSSSEEVDFLARPGSSF